MLLRGAYSAKYQAAFQEKIENLKDEERQEFNVKLEKTKEFSRDTNRRRRALDERRKNYEAAEERKRREILAKRRKEIQEATEKFQRSNIIRNRKKIKQTENTARTRAVKHIRTLPVSAKSPKLINGQPYYPSVEEVMALLHADRAKVIENPSDKPNQTSDDAVKPKDTTDEQHIIEQEKLRSEVVGRIEPKLAFIEDGVNVTAGVLPATMRRNSPSGSLSSMDSLDTVPPEELEAIPVSNGSLLTGIIRKGNRLKRDGRVTFNENVTFSDGVVGTLRRKQTSEPDSSLLLKQKSYFELLNEGSDNELEIGGKGLESSKDSLIVNQGSRELVLTSTLSYPHVSYVATTGVMSYSMADNSRKPAVQPNLTASESKRKALHLLPNSPRADGLSNRGHQLKGSETGGIPQDSFYDWNKMEGSSSSSTLGGNESKTDCRMDNGKEQSGRGDIKSDAHNGNAVNVQGSIQRKVYVNGNTSDDTSNDKDKSSCSLPFSSINASALKDSLEMHNNIRVSHSDTQQTAREQAQKPPSDFIETHKDSNSSAYDAKHMDVPPETPLIPITKRDFLSKALRPDHNVCDTKSLSDDVMVYKDEVFGNGRIQANGFTSRDCKSISSYKDFDGSSGLTDSASEKSRSEQDSSHGGYTMYSEDGPSCNMAVHSNSRLAPSSNDTSRQNCKSGSYSQVQNVSSGMNVGSSTHNDKYSSNQSQQHVYNDMKGHRQTHGLTDLSAIQTRDKQKQTLDNDSYNQRQYNAVDSLGERNTVVSSPARTVVSNYSDTALYSDRLDSSLKSGTSRDTQVIQRPSRTYGESSSAIPLHSKEAFSTSSDEKFRTVQSRKTPTTNMRNFASRKPYSADELLKSVQENIERISMTPSQQDISRTNNSNVGPGGICRQTASDTRLNSHGRPTRPSEKAESRDRVNSAAVDRERKFNKAKVVINGQNSMVADGEKQRRFHRTGSDPAIGNQRTPVNIEYGATLNNNHEIKNRNSDRPSTCTSRVHAIPPHHMYAKTDYHSRAYQNRPYGLPTENRSLHPLTTNGFEKRQRMNSNGLGFLDKTPTDEDINNLWATVRTCLKHEQPPKAASDSIVNNVRYSRSESGPLVGNHYLIEGDAWAPRGASDSDSRYSRPTVSTQFHRQGSLDSLRRQGSAESVGYPPRKRSLLQHRSHTSDRRLLPRNSQSGRPPMNAEYLHALRGPLTSNRGPQKSSTLKTDGRPQLSYAEFQAVMQASADIKTRNTEGEAQTNSRPSTHQPIIMNHRKEPSALSLEEKRLLESLDRLNERLKVQEAFAGKVVKGPRNGNLQNKASSPKFSPSLASNNRFGTTRVAQDKSNTSGLLNRR